MASTSKQLSSTTTIAAVHQDIIETHILTRLDGPTLASAGCSCSQLYTLSSQEQLWSNICRSTWPSTVTPRVQQIISAFPGGGPRAFFASSFSNPDAAATQFTSNRDRPSELISAVDVYHREGLVFSKVVETETVSGWFRCSPFRVDLLDPKDRVATRVRHPDTEDACAEMMEDLKLSWILIDPIGRRAMNLSSHKPVSVERHWLTGDVKVRFASVLAGERGSPSEFVQCGVVVTCGASQAGEMHVREVSLQVEDMDGMFLNGKDSLVILQRGLEGKKRRQVEGKKRYEEYLEMKKARKERKLRTEGTLDMLGVAFGVLLFASLGLYVFWR